MRLSLVQEKPIIWGHRGGRSLAPENTLLALEKCYESGAHGWELDVSLSKDGVPILLHDLCLLRTTDAASVPLFASNPPAVPWRFTLEELRQLNAGMFPRRQCGGQSLQQRMEDDAEHAPEMTVSPVVCRDCRQHIPTLEEALLRSKELDLWVNVEIKDVSQVVPKGLATGIVERVLAVIVAAGMEERVIVSSFNHDYIVECKQAMRHVATGALTPHLFTDDPVTVLQETGADAWHPGFRHLTSELVTRVREAGKAINPYTVNRFVDMTRLVQWGVTGLVTDNPHFVQHHTW